MRACNFIKTRLQHSYFPVKFEKQQKKNEGQGCKSNTWTQTSEKGDLLNYATNPSKSERPTTILSDPQRPTTSQNDPQRLTTTTPKIAQYNFMYTLCFIYNEIIIIIIIIIISCFHGLLFLIFNTLLFSFVKLKLHTYRNSCRPSDLTKIKTSCKNNTKLRLLSKKLKIARQFTFNSRIFITRLSHIGI